MGNGEDEENLVSVQYSVLVTRNTRAARNSIVVDDRPCMQHACSHPTRLIDRYVVQLLFSIIACSFTTTSYEYYFFSSLVDNKKIIRNTTKRQRPAATIHKHPLSSYRHILVPLYQLLVVVTPFNLLCSQSDYQLITLLVFIRATYTYMEMRQTENSRFKVRVYSKNNNMILYHYLT